MLLSHINKSRLFKSFIHQQTRRNKITITKLDASESAEMRRPSPILLLRTLLSKEQEKKSNAWSDEMQKQFSRLGYSTVDAAMTLPEKKSDQLLLQTCYQELSQATSDLSFFPPLFISHGEIASRISQKFVSNKPVSGLIMIQAAQAQAKQAEEEEMELCNKEFPISEFEPRFPLFMISNDSPPEFLDGWIDHVKLGQDGKSDFEHVMQWMDDVGM